ncbi:ATPase, F0/V0 complex, subunit C [Candidatus Omnitrophus magneticus]|uniref:ATP synthase subunit c n=1 Tax=Candidatus Omnitrophus magneticus TaxID=1609969 RepID=A0A0F0CWL6_9BACT|nr:ATPase, F0/V0 complex, subunit C [Candidatus Omnitrophus magneticus]
MVLALPLGLGLAAFGGCIGMGIAMSGAFNAMGRQPEMTNKLLVNMTIACAFIESIIIYVLVVVFMLLGRL